MSDIMYADDAMSLHNEANGPQLTMTRYFAQFAKWRHRGRSLRSPTTSCLLMLILDCHNIAQTQINDAENRYGRKLTFFAPFPIQRATRTIATEEQDKNND